MIKNSFDYSTSLISKFFGVTFIILCTVSPLIVYIRAVNLYGVAPWQTGDWLIDYSGGFIRRGLAGELTLFLSSQTGVNRTFFVLALQTIAQLTFAWGVVRLYLAQPRTKFDLLLIASPMSLVFLINDYQAAMKKEILIYLLILLIISSTYTSEKKLWRVLVYASILYVLFGLTHEIVILGSPLILYSIFLKLADHGLSKKFWTTVMPTWSLLSISMLVALLTPTADSSVEAICESARLTTLDENACQGAIEFLYLDSSETFNLVAQTYWVNGSVWGSLLATVLLSSIPLIFFKPRKGFFIAICFTVIAMLPAFVLALDWGRWLAVIVTGASILILGYSSQRLHFGKGKKYNLLSALMICAYSGSWSMGSIVTNDLSMGWLSMAINAIFL